MCGESPSSHTERFSGTVRLRRENSAGSGLLPLCCLCPTYQRRLTFHTEFGAPTVFVDEDEKDEEKKAGEAHQADGDGNLRRMTRSRQEDVARTAVITGNMHIPT